VTDMKMPPAGDGGPTEGRNKTFRQAGEQVDSIPPVDQRRGLLDAALWWAGQGFAILPLEPMSNIPHRRMLGKFGSRDTVASRELGQVRDWWTRDRAANIGIVTGPVNGVVVVDADAKPGQGDGIATWLDWCADKGFDFSDTMVVESPTGGRHYWLKSSESLPQATSWIPNVDAPWQVAVPPSHRMVLPNCYLPYRLLSGNLDTLRDAPDVLLSAIRQRSGSNYPSGESIIPEDHLPDLAYYLENGFGGLSGSRNQDCFRLARRLWSKYDDEATVVGLIMPILHATALKQGDPFTWREAHRCIESAGDYHRRQYASDRALAESLLRRWRR
jgi:Bifunctional DNA primase/polymerase, N-terminal